MRNDEGPAVQVEGERDGSRANDEAVVIKLPDPGAFLNARVLQSRGDRFHALVVEGLNRRTVGGIWVVQQSVKDAKSQASLKCFGRPWRVGGERFVDRREKRVGLTVHVGVGVFVQTRVDARPALRAEAGTCNG